MTLTAAILCCLLSADVRPPSVAPPTKLRLVLTPNTSKILQHDNLLLRVMLEVPRASKVTVVVEPPHELDGYYFRIEIKASDDWRRLLTVREELVGAGCLGSARWTFPAGSRYAEYNWFHRDRGLCIFDKPGKYELRAVANLTTGELVSDPVTITVSERPAADLERIDQGRFVASFSLTHFHRGHLDWGKPDDSRPYESLGGNIKTTIKHFALLHEFVRTNKVQGKEVSKNEMCTALQRQMDPISWEYTLTFLGGYYATKADLESLTNIVRAAPAFDSRGFLASAEHLKSLRQKLANESNHPPSPPNTAEALPK
ncbi:MAG: hypothetical protein L0211_13415 [Planctomycetaceae bacterium]|nr:hypothetical protein [Planctomycetaceae bacterium]